MQNVENVMFSLFCLLSQDRTVIGPKNVCLCVCLCMCFSSPSSHTLPIPTHTGSAQCQGWHLSVLSFTYLFSSRLHSSCPTSNHSGHRCFRKGHLTSPGIQARVLWLGKMFLLAILKLNFKWKLAEIESLHQVKKYSGSHMKKENGTEI